MYLGFHVNTRYYCQILVKVEFSGQIVETHADIKFRENPFSWSRFVSCGLAGLQT
jgi:hypothetical protein